jgi:uncharacterized membrane protein
MKETLKRYGKRYFIDAMGGMAQGLFASLLIGTIIGTLGGYIPVAPIREFLLMVASVCKIISVIAFSPRATIALTAEVTSAVSLFNSTFLAMGSSFSLEGRESHVTVASSHPLSTRKTENGTSSPDCMAVNLIASSARPISAAVSPDRSKRSNT